MKKKKIGKALTWNELADIFDAERVGSRPARTLPMKTVFRWAKSKKDKFIVTEDGCIHQIIYEETNGYIPPFI